MSLLRGGGREVGFSHAFYFVALLSSRHFATWTQWQSYTDKRKLWGVLVPYYIRGRHLSMPRATHSSYSPQPRPVKQPKKGRCRQIGATQCAGGRDNSSPPPFDRPRHTTPYPGRHRRRQISFPTAFTWTSPLNVQLTALCFFIRSPSAQTNAQHDCKVLLHGCSSYPTSLSNPDTSSLKLESVSLPGSTDSVICCFRERARLCPSRSESYTALTI